MDLFEVKVKYTATKEDGSLKRVTHAFITDAVSFGEAEEKMFKYMEELGHSGEIVITSIKRDNITDIIFDDSYDVWYRAIVAFDSEDPDSGKSKVVKQHVMIQSDSVKRATSGILDFYRDSVVPIDVKSVKETDIQDITINK